jgi:hypothetical protein
MSLTIPNQAKLASVALAAVLAFTAFGAGTALAVSESERTCEAEFGPGAWDKATKTCTGSSEEFAGGSDTSWTSTSEQEAHGNLKNPHTPEPTTTCDGPGGSEPGPKCD